MPIEAPSFQDLIVAAPIATIVALLIGFGAWVVYWFHTKLTAFHDARLEKILALMREGRGS